MVLPTPPKDLSFENQSVLITGSNTGIGLEVARVYLRRKAKLVYLAVRSLEKGNSAIETLRQDEIIAKENPDAEIKLYQVDQGSFESVRSFAQKFTSEVKSLNTAILNAGVVYYTWAATTEGWESNFQINYFSAALLTLELLPLLKQTGKTSSIQPHLFFTSSLTSNHARLSWESLLSDDINLIDHLSAKENFSSVNGYSASKLFLTMFAEELATCELDLVITSACPGVVQTSLDRNMPSLLFWPVWLLKKSIGRDIMKAAELLVFPTTTENTGTYWADGVVKPHAAVMDTEIGKAFQKKLFKQTLQRCKEIDSAVNLPATASQ